MEKILVVKIGGNVIDSPTLLRQFLQDFSKLPYKKILVHGGGKVASKLAQTMGLPVLMHNGRRITDQAMLEVVIMTYAGTVNKLIVSQLQALQTNAIGLTGADANLMLAYKRPPKEIDYGWVGDVSQTNLNTLQLLLRAGLTPVIAPLTHDGKGQMLNTNADTMASQIAVALAEQYQTNLVYCFEKKGVLTDLNNEDSVISHLTPTSYQKYLQEQTIYAGMIPKLDNAFAALQKGVNQVVIAAAEALPYWETSQFVGTLMQLDKS